MAKKTITKELEEEADKYFRNLLPNSWEIRDEGKDNGFDFSIEIFHNGNNIVDRFYVQSKSKLKADSGDKITFPILIERLKDYSTSTLPVFLYGYNSDLRKAWGLWINDYFFIKKLEKSQKKHSISFEKNNSITAEYFALLANHFDRDIHKRLYLSFELKTSDKNILKFINKFKLQVIKSYSPCISLEEDVYPRKIAIEVWEKEERVIFKFKSNF
jgi:hypothetical protein